MKNIARNKSILFVCGTEFQLLMAFVLSTTVYRANKKVLMLYFNNRVIGFFNNAIKSNVWDEVLLIDDSPDRSSKNPYISKIIRNSNVLHYFTWGFSEFNKIFSMMANAGKSIVLTDEGVLTYHPVEAYSRWVAENPGRESHLMGFDVGRIDEIWLCEPDLFSEKINAPIFKIRMDDFGDNLRRSPTLQDKTKRLFSWVNRENTNIKIVYFQQYSSSVGTLTDYADTAIDQAVCSVLDKPNFYVRRHPATLVGDADDGDNSRCPWELWLLLSDLDKAEGSDTTVYISSISSAMHSTALMNRGGTYIYLYKLVRQYTNEDQADIDKIVQRVMTLTEGSGAKFYIPETWDSLREGMSEISDGLGLDLDISKIPSGPLDLDGWEQLSAQTLRDHWGVPGWLLDRQPTQARIVALQAIINANPEIGSLGVVVVDTARDEAAIQATLSSVQAQYHRPGSCWVISPVKPESIEGVEWLYGSEPWSEVLNRRLKQDGIPDCLLIIPAGDILLPQALLLMDEYRLNHRDVSAWYIDEDVLEDGVSVKPMLKPDFNLDLLRSYPYVGRVLAFSTAVIHELGGLDSKYGDLSPVDMIWRFVEHSGPPAVGHVPEVLVHRAQSLFDWVEEADTDRLSRSVTQAHLERMGVRAEMTPASQRGLQRIHYQFDEQPLVSIIIPTRDQLPVLRECIDGLMANTEYPRYELLIVDNRSIESDACEFLTQLEGMQIDQVRVLRWPHPFNYSGLNNFAVQQAHGEVLLFLNNDVQVIDKKWLSLMLGNALRPEIGLVGARLDYPDGRVQHGGLVLGMDNSVGFAFQGLSGDLQGYMSRLQAAQNVSAVSAACLMMRRTVYDELGGFDEEAFPIYYGDADLCMKATQAGYLMTIVPDTGLKHMGGATRLLTEKFGLTAEPDDQQRDRLYAKWLPQLARDSAYHPAFDKFSPGFSLSPDAARIQEPLPGRPLPVVLASHADWHGCGHYRIVQPFQALEGSLQVEGGLKLGDFHFTDVARIQPDVIVLQGAWAHVGMLKQIERYRELTGAKVALEFDDYVPNIPVQSIYRKLIPQSVIKQMRRAIEQVDWLVVSTPVLAEEYADYHQDIRIAKNGLYLPWWQGLKGQRRVGEKLRVGWAGGSSHTGDLAEIRALVKDMENEVEWVFMGMQPEGIQCEFHPGVPIEQYPKKLADLNLDLAVVPLELNQFNRSKSNLRLLEMGACGVPVICTDIEPYRCGLPVTLVRNRYQDWAEAVRSHLAEPEALARQGDSLREAVLRDWVLEGEFLGQWVRAWLPG